MSESILDIVAQYASPGTSVKLTLLTQEKVLGRIESIKSTVVVIQQANGNIRLIKSENLIDFEIISSDSESKGNFSSEVESVESQQENIAKETTQPQTDISVEKTTKEQIIKPNNNIILFKRDIILKDIDPIFDIGDITNGEKQDLNKIKNKYDYAIKIHELGRIRQAIPELEEIAANANNHAIHLLCGQFAKLMGDRKKAEKYYQ
nr:hypothetical protein [Desulfobulbaceae bacterium]